MAGGETMTVDQVRTRLEEAMTTLRNLRVIGTYPAQHRTQWPGMLVDFWEMWNGLTQSERRERERQINHTLQHPTPAQISRMDEVLPGWLHYIGCPRDRRVVLAVAAGTSLRKASRFDGRSHECIRYTYKRGLQAIARGLRRKRFDDMPCKRLVSL